MGMSRLTDQRTQPCSFQCAHTEFPRCNFPREFRPIGTNNLNLYESFRPAGYLPPHWGTGRCNECPHVSNKPPRELVGVLRGATCERYESICYCRN